MRHPKAVQHDRPIHPAAHFPQPHPAPHPRGQARRFSAVPYHPVRFRGRVFFWGLSMESLLDAFFGSAAPESQRSKSQAAREFFAAHSGMREKEAREALRNFNALPDRVRAAIFTRAKVEQRALYELSPRERVRLLEAAEKIMDEIAAKMQQAKTAVSSLGLLVAFKGDRGIS